jgi:outer membrane protein with beta-barrel domain
MRNLILMAVVLAFTVPLAYAQSSDDYNKVEVYGGYSHSRTDTGIENTFPVLGDDLKGREGFNGFNASVTANLSRYVGLKFDSSGNYRSDALRVNLAFPCQPAPLCLPAIVPADVRARASLYNFLGGVQFKDNSAETRLKPYAHLLVGAARTRVKVDEPLVCAIPEGCPVGSGSSRNILNESDTGFAGAFGGGLDIRVGKRIDVRVIQLDYNPTRLFDNTQHNFRAGAGIVFH